MDGTAIVGGGVIGAPGGTWAVAGVGDFHAGPAPQQSGGAGSSDILFQDASHNLAVWQMNGTAIVGGGAIGAPGAVWHVLG